MSESNQPAKPIEPGQNMQQGPISDHLANERTFLAWVRTSIAIMAFGFVVVKFTLFVKQISLVLAKPLATPGRGYSAVIGTSLVAIGVLICLLAYLRFRLTERQIDNRGYKPSNLLLSFLTAIILLAGLFLVLYLIHNVQD